MKKTDIKEGSTYRSKNGRLARRVLRITDKVVDLDGKMYATQWEPPWVLFEFVGGSMGGRTGSMSLANFSAASHSEDTGAPESVAELRAKLEEMRKALEPFGAYYRTMSKMGRPMPQEGEIWSLQVGAPDEAAVGYPDLSVEFRHLWYPHNPDLSVGKARRHACSRDPD